MNNRLQYKKPLGRIKRAFTLLELLIVIAVIAVLASIAIPNLLTARMAANEDSAIESMRLIRNGMEYWRLRNIGGDDGYPPDFRVLGDGLPPELDPKLASGTRSGYTFAGGSTGDGGWAVTAVPVTYKSTGVRSYYVDGSGVIRSADKNGAPAAATDAPID